MNEYEKMREHIIAMQVYAAQNPQKHADLIIQLHRTRTALEKLM
jgi:hypothetical protein